MILGEQRKEEIEKKTEKESYQIDIQQRCYMDRMTKGSTKNIGDSWRGIGTNGKEKERKGLTKKKRKKKSRKEG